MWVYPVKCDVTDTADVGVRGHIGHCLPDKVLHLFQPALVLWVDLVGFLDCFERVDLQRIFLRFGPCLRLAIGGFGNTFLRSGLSISMVLL